MAALPELFAASRAMTVIALLPAIRATLQDQLAVPLATTVVPVAELVHVTWVTLLLSDAVPPRLMGVAEVVYVGFEVGEVMVAVGGEVSDGV